jgi:uncharacterized protein
MDSLTLARMQKPKNLHALDVKAFAKAQMHLEGDTPVAEFERLAEDCSGEVTGHVSWSAQGAIDPEQRGKDDAWLHLEAKATVLLTCQRCLHPVPVELLIEQDFRFVADEATALAEDDDCEEDLLSPAPELTLQTLLEDELLLAMPLIPRHTTCDKPLPQSPDQDLPHPFAALADMKLGKQ